MASVNNHEISIKEHENKIKKLTRTSLNDIDYNTLKSEGVYFGYTGLTNSASNGISVTDVKVYSPDWIVQKQYFPLSDGSYEEYVRTRYNGDSWSSWKKIWIQGDAITNAVWNDYAERFEKPVELKTEPGDIIALDKSTETEMYKLAEEGDSNIVGVHSDEYGMLIGGVADDEKYNKEHFIPVGMIGRVRTKVIGPIHKGDRIVPSNIPGVGRIFENGDNMFAIVGFATETNLDPNIKKVRTKINTY